MLLDNYLRYVGNARAVHKLTYTYDVHNRSDTCEVALDPEVYKKSGCDTSIYRVPVINSY